LYEEIIIIDVEIEKLELFFIKNDENILLMMLILDEEYMDDIKIKLTKSVLFLFKFF
jgi:hypothetical protein